MKALFLLLALGGCSQILGLDNTSFDQRDAAPDAPSVCDGAPRCMATTGRSVCGQLVQTGAMGGQALRVASPTGMTCAVLASTEGPCALSIHGQPQASFFAANATDAIAGDIDDCGRFVIPDLDQTVADIAVVAKGGTDFIDSAVLLRGRMKVVGTDQNLALPVVTAATETAWGMELDPSNPTDVQGGYLVTYENAMGVRITSEELRVNGGPVGKPPSLPWGAYFTGAIPFSTLDPAQTTTQETGTAVVHPAGGTFMLGGFRQGRTCTQVPLQSVPGVIVSVTLSC